MYRKHNKKLKFILVLLVQLITFNIFQDSVSADDGSQRTMTISVEYTEYYWWLVRKSDNIVECELAVDHDDLPTFNDIYQQCWKETYQGWVNEALCELENDGQSVLCPGFYFHHTGESLKSKEVTVELPPATVQLTSPNCSSINNQPCVEIPKLILIGEEPLPNEEIIQIQGLFNNIPFVCSGPVCEIQLRETENHGVPLVFWVDSSYGDTSFHHEGQVRVIRSATSDSYGPDGWYVDFLNISTEDNAYQGCSRIWQSFPPPGKPPDWLQNPDQPDQLRTEAPLLFLAGKLIQKGYVKAEQCENYGLTADGYATQCGLEQAREEVNDWQNVYDPHIIEVAQESSIPAQLIKRIIEKESQFWPGLLEHTYMEHGLGQLTDLGVDSTLLWNHDFFNEFCPLVLSENACDKGYAHLGDWEQEILRGIFLSNTKIDLPTLLGDFDQEQIRTSLSYLGEVIIGNCHQVGKMIENQTSEAPGQVSSYEDLWRFTLVNYHAGPGCLAEAMTEVSSNNKPFIWENISMELEFLCPYAIDYVSYITK